MKRIICFALAVVMMLGALVSVSAHENKRNPKFIPWTNHTCKKLDRDVPAHDTSADEATADEATCDEMYVLLGDWDDDGRVTVKDATQVQKYAAGLIGGGSFNRTFRRCDADENNTLNIKDATAMQKHCAGIGSGRVGEYIKLDGTTRVFYDMGGELEVPVYCYGYAVGQYTGFDDLFERGKCKEASYNKELGLYVLEIPDYCDLFVLKGEENYTTSITVPKDRDMVFSDSLKDSDITVGGGDHIFVIGRK